MGYKRKARVLFLDRDGAGPASMAVALAQAYAGTWIEARCAGLSPGEPDPLMAASLAEKGLAVPADGGAVPAPEGRRCDPGAGGSAPGDSAGTLRACAVASPLSGAPAPCSGAPAGGAALSSPTGSGLFAWADLVVTLDAESEAACPRLAPGVQRRHYDFTAPSRDLPGQERLQAWRALGERLRLRIEGMAGGMGMMQGNDFE